MRGWKCHAEIQYFAKLIDSNKIYLDDFAWDLDAEMSIIYANEVLSRRVDNSERQREIQNCQHMHLKPRTGHRRLCPVWVPRHLLWQWLARAVAGHTASTVISLRCNILSASSFHDYTAGFSKGYMMRDSITTPLMNYVFRIHKSSRIFWSSAYRLYTANFSNINSTLRSCALLTGSLWSTSCNPCNFPPVQQTVLLKCQVFLSLYGNITKN